MGDQRQWKTSGDPRPPTVGASDDRGTDLDAGGNSGETTSEATALSRLFSRAVFPSITIE